MSQREVNVIKFRDAVAEIFRPCSELLAKQHALRVETYAPPIRHALRDEFGADGVRYPSCCIRASRGHIAMPARPKEGSHE